MSRGEAKSSRRMTDVFEFEVPKTVGEDGRASLRIDIRSDEDVLGPGLFVYGFLPDSNAEQQGLVRIGDELLMVNDMDVEAGTLDDLVVAMQSEEYKDAGEVPMMVRRQMDHSQSRHVSKVSTPFTQLPPVQENVLSPFYSQHSNFSHPEDTPLVNDSVAGRGESPGGMQLDIRSDPQMFDKGLFIFGFLCENSLAEQQGNIQIGDEVLEVNGINVAGGTAEDIEDILVSDVFPDVLLKVYRSQQTPSVVSSAVTREFIKVNIYSCDCFVSGLRVWKYVY